jgi:uncharacterized repeat protein (TIGR03803 family)
MSKSPKATLGSVLVLLLAPTLMAAHEPDTGGHTGKFKITHSFDGSDAENPQGWYLVQGRNNKLYGVSQTGGAFDAGTVYEVGAGGSVRVLHTFSGGTEGEQPQGLAVDDRGNVYGVTIFGGTPECSCGTVFRISRDGSFQVLHRFTGDDGAQPSGHFVFKDGVFYGTTQSGGANGVGAIFRMRRSGEVSVIHSFANLPDGFGPVFPSIGLSLGADGMLYGTTAPSSSYPEGIVYRSTTDGEVEILHVFDGPSGSQPYSVPIQAADGNRYGTTAFGGEFGSGVLYRIDANGAFSVMLSFPDRSTGPAYPYGKLVQGSNGSLYGTTAAGGAADNGTIYEIRGGTLRTLYEFKGGFEGDAGITGLTERSPDVFFGISPDGGSAALGSIYRFKPGK